jgi:hypothetical protein
LTGACSFVVCKLGSCCVHSSAPQFDRSLREGAPCATLSMLTYYRTSRSLHFPFWAVCSLSGAQPEIWSVGWNPPVHRIAFRLFVAFPFNPRPSSSAPPEGEGAPGSSGPVHSGRHTAQDGSEDVDDRSRLRPDALPFRRFVFGHIVDSVHAFATRSRELRLA